MRARLRLLALLACGISSALVGGVRPTPAVAADDSTEALVQSLVGADDTPRYEAYRQLSAKRPAAALPLIAKALPAAPPLGQNYGISIVAGYPPAQAKPVYEKWAAGDAPYLKVAAGAALYRAGDAKAAAVIVEALSRRDFPFDVLSYSLSCLYGIKEPSIERTVRGYVRRDSPTAVLEPVLRHLLTAKDLETRPLAAALTKDDAPAVRAMGAVFLLRMGDESQAEVVAAALRDPEFSYVAFTQINSLLAIGPRLPDVVLDALLALVETPRAGWSLVLVLSHLGTAGYPKAAPALRALLDSTEAGVGKAAFEALSKIPGGIDPERMKSLLESGDDARRLSAAEALRRADDLSGLAATIDVLKNGKSNRGEAARVLGTFRVRAAVEPLIDALSDADLSVRANAQSSLQTLLTTLFPYRRLDFGLTGYNSASAPAANADAIARIRAWYESAKSADW